MPKDYFQQDRRKIFEACLILWKIKPEFRTHQRKMQHNDDRIIEEECGYKPDIILQYYKTKGGMDTTYNLTKDFTTQIKNIRCPMTIFFFYWALVAATPLNYGC